MIPTEESALASALDFRSVNGTGVDPQHMFDCPTLDEARSRANLGLNRLRSYGPSEPHDPPPEEMRYIAVTPTIREGYHPLGAVGLTYNCRNGGSLPAFTQHSGQRLRRPDDQSFGRYRSVLLRRCST